MDGAILGWILLICAILAGLFGIYALIKAAVKDAIREMQVEIRYRDEDQ